MRKYRLEKKFGEDLTQEINRIISCRKSKIEQEQKPKRKLIIRVGESRND